VNARFATSAMILQPASESDMEYHHTALAGDLRLRVVFDKNSIALGLPAGATLGDIADWLGDAARLHNGALRSVDVKMGVRQTPAFDGAH
jgi:hypothetical protein